MLKLNTSRACSTFFQRFSRKSEANYQTILNKYFIVSDIIWLIMFMRISGPHLNISKTCSAAVREGEYVISYRYNSGAINIKILAYYT